MRISYSSPGPLGYDALIVAAGADPVRPPVPGIDRPGVFTIRSLDEAIELRRFLDGGAVRRAVVVGAGYIGLETAEALVCAGVEVEVVEALPRVLGTVDEPIAEAGPARSWNGMAGCGSGPPGTPCGDKPARRAEA